MLCRLGGTASVAVAEPGEVAAGVEPEPKSTAVEGSAADTALRAQAGHPGSGGRDDRPPFPADPLFGVGRFDQVGPDGDPWFTPTRHASDAAGWFRQAPRAGRGRRGEPRGRAAGRRMPRARDGPGRSRSWGCSRGSRFGRGAERAHDGRRVDARRPPRGREQPEARAGASGARAPRHERAPAGARHPPDSEPARARPADLSPAPDSGCADREPTPARDTAADPPEPTQATPPPSGAWSARARPGATPPAIRRLAGPPGDPRPRSGRGRARAQGAGARRSSAGRRAGARMARPPEPPRSRTCPGPPRWARRRGGRGQHQLPPNQRRQAASRSDGPASAPDSEVVANVPEPASAPDDGPAPTRYPVVNVPEPAPRRTATRPPTSPRRRPVRATASLPRSPRCSRPEPRHTPRRATGAATPGTGSWPCSSTTPCAPSAQRWTSRTARSASTGSPPPAGRARPPR